MVEKSWHPGGGGARPGFLEEGQYSRGIVGDLRGLTRTMVPRPVLMMQACFAELPSVSPRSPGRRRSGEKKKGGGWLEGTRSSGLLRGGTSVSDLHILPT